MRRYFSSPEILVFLTSCWIALTCNIAYWRVVVQESPVGHWPTFAYLQSFFLLTIGLISLALLILSSIFSTRIVLGISLIIAASTGYFTLKYGMLFDTGMFVNVLQTDVAEATDLLSPSLIAAIVVLGLLPAIAIWRYNSARRSLFVALTHRSISFIIAVSLIVVPLLASQKAIFSVARNHQELRHMIAPLNVFSASYRLARDRLETPSSFKRIAGDAVHTRVESSEARPTVHVLIVGETARADNFSLNGYTANTNPLLAAKKDLQFYEISSCGTATAVSLPCMFSVDGRENFDRQSASHEENLLDVAKRAGYDVYWVDNGNGCKGLCDRVEHMDVHHSAASAVCPEGECYDGQLVEELDRILDSVSRDTLIILHQLGSHGPAYFRRYPEPYASFQPDCRSQNFSDCSREEIVNAYNNTIVYTDHVISAAIDVLENRATDISASLVYVSDHGESLGEHGVYLHGMPYAFAPDAQTNVPLIVWSAESTPGSGCPDQLATKQLTHDNIFHSELGLLDIATSAYKPELDIFAACPSFTRVASTGTG